MVGQNRCGAELGLCEATGISLSAFPEFLNLASKATVEAGNSIVVFVIADLGSATRTASTQPNHQGRPRELHPLTVVLFVANSSVIMWLGSYI